MNTILFLQSEVQDPYKLYETMLSEHPVYWDEANRLWAVYSYNGCMKILNNPFAHIPAVNKDNEQGLNEYALKITAGLARLNNGMQHEIARQSAGILFDNMKEAGIAGIMEVLLLTNEADWVDISKKLPVMAIADGFGFTREDSLFMVNTIADLVKIMQPAKTQEQVRTINELAAKVYMLIEKYLSGKKVYKAICETISKKYNTSTEEAFCFCVSNLAGIFIQSYDAGRGVLGNSLFQLLLHHRLLLSASANKDWIRKAVIETLRFDPPVHNTRRVMIDDIMLNKVMIRQGQSIMVVLAAANRDPAKFSHPSIYDIERANNNEHLTYGAGNHMCIAKHFSVWMTTEALDFLFKRYKKVSLADEPICYEPLINVRIPQAMMISFS